MIGPLVISIKNVYRHIVLVAIAYFLFLLSFSYGMQYVLELVKHDKCYQDMAGIYDGFL